MEKIRAIKGMPDITPPDGGRWSMLEKLLSRTLASYGYRAIRLPMLEPTPLFQRSIGEVTDIIEKEMYSFVDRKQRPLSLRPEGTAGCVRAAIENNLLETPQKLWYCGPMFRYEKPQKGRQRQFHQLGAEAFGFKGYGIELETLLMQQRFWQTLGLGDEVKLQLNTIGTAQCRARYQAALVEYLKQHEQQLDADSQRRLSENPLRILDSKVDSTQALLDTAPKLVDYLCDESKTSFSQLTEALAAQGVAFELNSRLVRGLDYYNDTVFEWVSGLLGAQSTVCAGGRYDGLVEQLGGKSTAAFGFAIGLERLMLMMQARDYADLPASEQVDVYFAVSNSDYQHKAFAFCEQLRECCPELIVFQQLQAGSLKSQFKRADKLAAKTVVVLAESEYQEQFLTVKKMDTGEQIRVNTGHGLSELIEHING